MKPWLHNVAVMGGLLFAWMQPLDRVRAQENLALGKPVTVSSTQGGGVLLPGLATDGDLNTRWGSNWSDDQWIYVDLGESATVGRVLLRWENAYGSGYKIQVSDDAADWTDLTTVTGGDGGVDDLAVSGTGRYVRMLGLGRATGYGYSLWEFEVYADPPPDGPPVQTENQTIHLTFPVQGMAYAKVNVSPEPLAVTPPPPEGDSTPSVINPTEAVTYQLTFPPNTNVTISRNQFSGTVPNTDITLATVDYNSTPLTGSSVTTLAMDGASWNVVIGNTGGSGGNHPPANWIADPYVSPAPLPVAGDFPLVSPLDTLITQTRRPALSWAAVPDAVKYEVWLNLSRTDYDWMAPGRLLDRYTMVGTVTTGTTLDLAEDLPDRWTYQWYVVATLEDGASLCSDVGTFGLYQPVLTAVDDGVAVINGCRDSNKNGVVDPYEDWHNPPAVRTADLLARMTRHQKAMQLFFNTQVYPEAGFGFGPFGLNDLLTYQKAACGTGLGIPNIGMGDTIHGYKTVYPTQPGLAATRDLRTVWEVADVQRRESIAVGYRGTLSPLSEVGTKALYPRIQEGCGEDADFAAGMVRAMVAALQGGPEINPKSMMITTKHWASQGAGGETGCVYDGTTIWYHMRPWHAAIEAGTSSIMPGYGGSWLLATHGYGAGDDPGILGFLRANMGYQGVICTDWLPSGAWTRACTNGADVMGGADPAAMGTFEDDVPISRLDDAVTRVLDMKFRMGLFEDPYGGNTAGASEWHTARNVEIVHNAAVKSLTLLKNNGPLPLRLPAGSAIVVDGPRSDDPSCMVTWRSDFHENDFGSRTIYKAIVARAAQDGVVVYGPRTRAANPVPVGTSLAAAVVVVGESYFTHGTFWDKNSPYLPDDPIGPAHDAADGPQYALIEQYRNQGIPVIVVCLLPRPYVLTNVSEAADALMVVYRPGDEGGSAIAGMLFGDHKPTGRTPWQLPRSTGQIGIDDSGHYLDQPDKWDLPYDMGATTAELAAIRAAIAAGEHVEPVYGDPLYQFGSGIQGFGLQDATPPEAFQTLAPGDGQVIDGAMPALEWQAGADHETGIQRYEVYLDGNLVATLRKETRHLMTGVALVNGTHQWFVKAYNWADGVTTSPAATFVINDSTPPAAFGALSPQDGVTIADPSDLTFHWEQSSDDGTGLAGYQLFVDGAVVASVPAAPAVSETENLALGKSARASSTNDGTTGAAIDGNPGSRWGSSWTAVDDPDREWFDVDLGAIHSIRRVLINWENAYGREYLIQVSTDGNEWTTIRHETNGNGGTDDLTGLSGAARFVRMQGVKRATGYGYSMWEFQVFGKGTEHATVSLTPGVPHTWSVRAQDGAGNFTDSAAFSIQPGLTSLQQWRQSHFGTIDPADPVAGNLAAPLGDGVANLIKYALGLDPSQVAASGDLVSTTTSDDAFGLTFTRLKSATDITYRVEAAGDLRSWSEIWNSGEHPYTGGENPAESVTVLDPLPYPAPSGTGRFMRLRITVP